MIPPELAPVLISVPMAAGFVLYLLRERRKLIAARELRRQHPAE